MLNKTPITIAIEAAYGRDWGRHDFHQQTYISRRHSLPFMAVYGRGFGKSTLLNYQRLIWCSLGLSSGAALKAHEGRRPSPKMQRIMAYDPGHGEDQSVECVFEHNPTTGVLRFISSRIVKRQPGDRAWIAIDEWPWFPLKRTASSSIAEFEREYMCHFDGRSYFDER